ncbi:MAG: YfhO family protein [Lachnospiraceae bacterium]|nr:YfhO family protein [Lachnospiraceae bacterium]
MKRKRFNITIGWQQTTLVLSLLLPGLIMLALFVGNGIYPFGDRSFLSGDLYHQYMPFFSELLHKVRGGENLSFSFHVGIGSNFLALFVYYLASPFHLFSLLVPESHLMEFMSYLIVFKTGLAGLTSFFYLQRRSRAGEGNALSAEQGARREMGGLLLSCFYALSGFMAAYNYNIMWVDCVVLLPLIVLGLERLVREGRCGLYCITLALSILTNYYISIMICIFLVLYFLMLLVTERRSLGNICKKDVPRFALYSILAGGMAAVLLIPEVCAILRTDFGDMDFPEKIESYFSVLDMLARHCVCVSTERGLDHWPNIYCGSAVLLLIPMYVINRRISIRERFCRMALAGFMLLGFSTNILDFLWHGLNYPDSLPGRQSFIYIFLVLTMCYDAYCRVKETDERQILHGFLFAVGFILFCEKFIDHEDFEFGVKLLTLVLVSLYAVFLYLYRTREDRALHRGLAVMALTLAVAECAVNTGATSIGTVSRSAYLGQQEDYKALYEESRKREESFYRIEKFTRKTKNDGTLTGYPTASVFSSTLNSYVMDMYKRLGMRHSKVYYGFDGATALTSAMLNVRYMFGESPDYENGLYTMIAQSGDICLYECNAALPFGYVAPTGFDLPKGYENHGLKLQNRMVKDLNIDGELFFEAAAETRGDDVEFTAQEGGYYYAILTASGTAKVDCIGGSTGEEKYNDLKKGSVLYLGYLEKDQTITLTNGDEDDESPRIQADVFGMDEGVLRQALSVLSAQHMEQVVWENDSLTGSIVMEEAGRLILSVPYEAGWEVSVNGEETEGVLFGGCLMAFDLEPGAYSFEMKYVPEGLEAGIAVSAVSIAGFAAVMILGRRKRLRTAEGKKPIGDIPGERTRDIAIQRTAGENTKKPTEKAAERTGNTENTPGGEGTGAAAPARENFPQGDEAGGERQEK